jgi:hypothetical protein
VGGREFTKSSQLARDSCPLKPLWEDMSEWEYQYLR